MKPVIAITMGDFNGVGPEVVLKSITSGNIQKWCRPLLVGSIDVFDLYARSFRMKLSFREVDSIRIAHRSDSIPVFQPRKFHIPRIRPGSLSKEAGVCAGEALSEAIELAEKKLVDGIVTAPVSKEALNMGGYRFRGQTDLLGNHFGTADTLMLFISRSLRVGLATTHIPVSRISREISEKYLLKKLEILRSSLKKDFGVRKPAIAVLGLNPHAGEGGLLGNEENISIIPAVRIARKKGIYAEGPFPADAFFGSPCYKEYDAILALYHDQGLIPFKMLHFDNGVNVTAGLPIVRTSPDHGTAFGIAGKGTANPSSMTEAVRTAVNIIKNRNRPRR